MSDLPLVDSHRVHVRASLARTSEVMTRVARRLAEHAAPRAFVALWRLEPPSGFAVAASSPERIALVGHHRFARYELAFELRPAAGGGVDVCARTSAVFPRAAGRVYRALVIGSGGHATTVRALLRRIRRAAERTSPPDVE